MCRYKRMQKSSLSRAPYYCSVINLNIFKVGSLSDEVFKLFLQKQCAEMRPECLKEIIACAAAGSRYRGPYSSNCTECRACAQFWHITEQLHIAFASHYDRNNLNGQFCCTFFQVWRKPCNATRRYIIACSSPCSNTSMYRHAVQFVLIFLLNHFWMYIFQENVRIVVWVGSWCINIIQHLGV